MPDPETAPPENTPPAETPPADPALQPRRVVLITGLSGAGRASILHVLEDLGYEAVDNPPMPLIEELEAKLKLISNRSPASDEQVRINQELSERLNRLEKATLEAHKN